MKDHASVAAGRHIRALMRDRDVTQTAVAASLGLAQSAVSRRISGEIAFNVTELARLAELLGVPVAELLPEAVAS